MRTRTLMVASAVVMGVAGLALQFAPHEVLAAGGLDVSGGASAAAQVTGALYVGFAMLNWMSRGARIGGIYARPLATGNLVHFVAGGLALLKHAAQVPSTMAWAAALVYVAFACAYALVAFTDPADLGTPRVVGPD